MLKQLPIDEITVVTKSTGNFMKKWKKERENERNRGYEMLKSPKRLKKNEEKTHQHIQ